MTDGEIRQEGMHPISMLAMYFVSEGRWEVYSSKMTNWPEGPGGPYPENVTLLDVFGPPVEPFTEMDVPGSNYTVGAEAYRARFRLLFNASIIPGFYMFGAMAFDDNFNPIAESQGEIETSGRLIGLDLHDIVNDAFGGYYTIRRENDDGDVLYTANRGEDFNVTVTVSNATLMDNVTIMFSAPSNTLVEKWVYGPYYETQTRYGAWKWDETAGTYVWNSSVEVTWNEPKFGYHWEETYSYVDLGKEYFYFDPFGSASGSRWTWPEYAISYDFTTSGWTYHAAYHYENHTYADGDWQRVWWWEYESWQPEWPVPYILNETVSSVFYNALGKLVVNFRGHISEEMLPSGSENGDTLHTEERLYNVLGQELVNYVYLPIASPQEALDYENMRRLAIDSPVSIVKITQKGQPFEPGWLFQTDIDETFTVGSRLQGGVKFADDIDGVAFTMYGHQERWGSDMGIEWWQYSDIQVDIKINPIGVVNVSVYNYTVRTSWGYGEHYEWIEVEIAPGIWDFERVLVEDWFWQEQIWDFQAGDWTNRHFPMKSAQARMPVNYFIAGNASYHLDGDDLRVLFDVTTLPEAPNLEWYWEYFYGNLTWVTDYESGWGSHTVLGWTEDTVYHYINGSEMLYVEKPYESPVWRNEDTGEIYEREKIPYVMIGGKPEPLKPYLFGDLDYTYESLIREDYDYVLDETQRYIKLYNGTELEVFGDRIASVFNVTLANGTSFLAFHDYPQYMGMVEGWEFWYMIAVDGSLVVGDWPGMWAGFFVNRVDVAPVTMVDYTYVSYATPIVPYEPNKTKPIYMAGWPEYVGPDHYVMHVNESGLWTPYDLWRYWEPGSEWLYYYHNHTDGRIYVMDWPWELMEANYLGQDVLIPHFTTQFYAYVVVGGTNYPIPAPGEPIYDWYDLEWVIRNYYSVEIAYIDGTAFVAEYDQQLFTPGPPHGYNYDIYQANVSNVMYNLTDWGFDPMHGVYVKSYWQFPDAMPWVTRANGTFVPEILHTDWTIAVGNTSASLEFEPTAWLDTVGGYYDGDYHSSSVSFWNGTHDIVQTMAGENFTVGYTWRAVFHNITLSNGTFFYSASDHPNIWPTDLYDPYIDTFYMIDIYGNNQSWTGWDEYSVEVIVVEDVQGADPWTGSFWFDGAWINVTQYNVAHWEWDGYMWYIMDTFMQDNVFPYWYDYLQAANGTKYQYIPLWLTPDSYMYNFPSWQFFDDGTWYNVTGSSDMIYKAYRFEGYSKKLDYAPLPFSVIRMQDKIVTGTPEFGMWDVELYTIDPATGALDLDGDLDTTDDQYFVKEFHTSTDTYNITEEYMDVVIYWEPDNSTSGDEFFLHSFTGMVTFNWTFEWADYYIWTKASTGETLSTAEMDAVRDTLLDQWGNSKPGYWDVAWLANNFTSEDLIQQAIDEGWDWAVDNSREWSWLWWELEEAYSTEVVNESVTELADIYLAYQYAGMFAWEDSNDDNFMDIDVASLGNAEMTHYWMPVDVDSVSFVTPGVAWGDNSTAGSEYRPVNETIDFGVSFTNVTGIVFPFGEFSYWDWYVGQYHGSDFNSFDERPTECTTEEFSLAVHFTGLVNQTVNIAQVKFDITVGQWDLDTPGGTNVLEDVSLAVSFLSDLTVVLGGGGGGASAAYIDDFGQVLNNDIASPSDNYTMAAGNSSVALMNLGGAPYSWAKNASFPATVTAQTMPLSAMSAMYLSGSGGTATTFSISSDQFYTLIGFKWWDGWAVTVDPIFVGYISHGDSTPPSINTVSHQRLEIGVEDYCHIQVEVEDPGGLDEVKVWDIDNNLNHTMTFNESSGFWEVDVLRTDDGIYDFNYQIVATDNAGNSAYTTTRTFSFWDNVFPEITTMSIENGTDGLGREIATVTATVIDEGGSGLDQVTLTYSNATGDFAVAMTPSGGDHIGTIPNHAPTTIVSYWVTVTDGEGNSVESSVQQFTFATGAGGDVYGPSISLIDHDPATPTSSQAVTVSGTILDVSGVDSAVLQYRIGTGAWVNVTMTPSGDTWSAMIPAQADGTSVTYRIVAYDSLGNEAISGEFSYEVSDATTTSGTSTTGPTRTTEPGEPFDTNLLIIIGGLGVLVLLIVVLARARRRS
jgi:hypothetical protein